MKVETGAENEVLRALSVPVKSVTGELRSFALDMIKTMHAEKGVGLAAPQVGRNIRLIVCILNVGEKNEIIIPMVNPVILESSKETNPGEEGCLSLPGVWGKVERSNSIMVRFMNLKNNDQTLELNDFNARIVQHEIDHLDGVLFVDKATDVKKDSHAESVKHI